MNKFLKFLHGSVVQIYKISLDPVRNIDKPVALPVNSSVASIAKQELDNMTFDASSVADPEESVDIEFQELNPNTSQQTTGAPAFKRNNRSTYVRKRTILPG